MKNNFKIFIIALFLLYGCKDEQPVSTSNQLSNNGSGSVVLGFNKATIPSTVSLIIATLSRTGYDSVKKNMNVLSDSSAEIFFDKIPVGNWKLNINAYNQYNILNYTGSTDIQINDGLITNVNLVLQLVESGVGGIKITVVWGTAPVPDWKSWNHFSGNPILTSSNSGFDVNGVHSPYIFRDKELYKMWYVNVGLTDGGEIGRIGYAYSSDGKNWIRPVSKSVMDVGNQGEWDSGWLAAGPVFRKADSLIMLYGGYSKITQKYNIGLARSSDGINWIKKPNPIFNDQKDWEYSIGGYEIILKDSLYYFYYTGSSSGKTSIGLGTSKNGIDWIRRPTPILTQTQSWEENGVNCPSVILDNGKFIMIYMNATSGVMPSFGMATSTDGINWIKESNNPIVTNPITSSSYFMQYPRLVKIGNEYNLYYSMYKSGSNLRQIGFATRK